MGNKYKWLLVIPVLTIMLGAYLLLSGEALVRNVHGTSDFPALKSEKSQDIIKEKNGLDDALSNDLKGNRESAYPYFLLGAGLLVALLILPKLGELSFSPTNGFTLKVLQEVKAAIDEAKTTTQDVETKTKQALRTNAPESLLAPHADLSRELTKLEANTARLDAYAALLEKMTEKKGRK